jgi:hypothetical protein
MNELLCGPCIGSGFFVCKLQKLSNAKKKVEDGDEGAAEPSGLPQDDGEDAMEQDAEARAAKGATAPSSSNGGVKASEGEAPAARKNLNGRAKGSKRKAGELSYHPLPTLPPPTPLIVRLEKNVLMKSWCQTSLVPFFPRVLGWERGVYAVGPNAPCCKAA